MGNYTMVWHVIEQTEQGYRIVKGYTKESSMWRAMKAGKPRWIIWCRRATLDNFSTLGMPNGWYWNGEHMEQRTMPVLPLVNN